MATNFHSSTLQRCWRALGRRRLESCSSSGMRAEKALRDGPVILGRNLLTYLMCLLGVPQPADCIGAGARAAPTLPPRPKPQPGVLVFTCMCACARARVCVFTATWVSSLHDTAHRSQDPIQRHHPFLSTLSSASLPSCLRLGNGKSPCKKLVSESRSLPASLLRSRSCTSSSRSAQPRAIGMTR